jgi:TRAP-type mannitol/chloroaromatic compound transport system permease large subunit
MNLNQALSAAREASHSLLAVLAAVAGSQAVVVAALGDFGVHISAADVSLKLGAVGAVVLAASKAIDSWNNAATTKAVTAVSGRPPV